MKLVKELAARAQVTVPFEDRSRVRPPILGKDGVRVAWLDGAGTFGALTLERRSVVRRFRPNRERRQPRLRGRSR
jgi:hypothetical protein